MVGESLRLGKRAGDAARRYGITRWQLSAWRSAARQGELAVEAVVDSESQPAFAALEVDSARGAGPMESVVVEARGVTVRLDGDIDALRIAEVAAAPRGLR